MSLLPNLLRSLLITSILSFLVPVFLIAAIWSVLFLIGCLPYLETIGQVGAVQVSHFLDVFGSGSPIRGVMVIGLVCSLVGVLFDTYAFYRYQK